MCGFIEGQGKVKGVFRKDLSSLLKHYHFVIVYLANFGYLLMKG
jgi:hypothetical protein